MRSGGTTELIMVGIMEFTIVGITDHTVEARLFARATLAITRVDWDMGLVTKCGGPRTTTRRT